MNRTRSTARSLDQLDLFNPGDVSALPAIELQIPITVPYGGEIEQVYKDYIRVLANSDPRKIPNYGVRTNAKKPVARWFAELFDVNHLGSGEIVSSKILHAKTRPEEAYKEFGNAVTRLHIVRQNGIVPAQVTYATQRELQGFIADAWYADPLMYKQVRTNRNFAEQNPAVKQTWYARSRR